MGPSLPPEGPLSIPHSTLRPSCSPRQPEGPSPSLPPPLPISGTVSPQAVPRPPALPDLSAPSCSHTGPTLLPPQGLGTCCRLIPLHPSCSIGGPSLAPSSCKRHLLQLPSMATRRSLSPCSLSFFIKHAQPLTMRKECPADHLCAREPSSRRQGYCPSSSCRVLLAQSRASTQ